MARAPKPQQDEPTRPRPTDDAGRVLDGHGLPIGGPARTAALGGRPDPALEEEPVVATPSPEQEQ